MPIKLMTLAMLSIAALPVAVQAQTADRTGRTAASQQTRTPQASPTPDAQQGKGGTLRGAIKGSAPSSDGTSTGRSGQVGGPDDARGNEERTNSTAAMSGAVDGRNALAPDGALTGPSGAPAVGSH